METVKAKLKTKVMTADISGPLEAVIGELFAYLYDPLRRQGMLRKLKAIDDRMTPEKPAAKDE